MALRFHSEAAPPLDVRRYTLVEEMNRPFRARVVAASLDPALDLGALLGEPVTLTLGPGAPTPQITGIARRARQLASGTPGGARGGDAEERAVTLYELEITPELALLRERSDNRIFQQLTPAQIVARVVESYAGLVSLPEVALLEDQEPREYLTQYGEADLAFVDRVLEARGVSYFFDHRLDSAWVITDHPARYVRALAEPVPYHEVQSAGEAGPHLFQGKLAESLEPGRKTVRAYDPDRPAFGLLATIAAKMEARRRGEAALERYEYVPGAFTAAAAAKHGEKLAERWLESRRARRRTLEVRASFHIFPGATLTLVGHPGDGVDGDWLVIEARTRSDERGSKHALRLVPVGPLAPYRPKRRTPRPRVAGVQTATVWGPPGEEIPVDAQGRVRVRFHWDRAALAPGEPPTRFLRVSQPWAGQGFGAMFLPRAGQEVVVDFLDGDPDEPIVIGRVHNGAEVPPLRLPAERTCSVIRTASPGGGYNEIRFDDAAGAEKLDLHAQRDSTWVTGRDAKRSVGKDDALHVAGSQRQVISGSKSVSIGGSKVLRAGKDVTVDAGERVFLRGGINIDEEAPWIDVRAGQKYRVGAPEVEVNGELLLLKGFAVEIGHGMLVHIKSEIGLIKIGELTIDAGVVTIKADEITLQGGTIDLNP